MGSDNGRVGHARVSYLSFLNPPGVIDCSFFFGEDGRVLPVLQRVGIKLLRRQI